MVSAAVRPVVDAPNIVVYSDVNPDVHVDSPFELVYNEVAIQKSLETVFATRYGSRPFRRRFGSKLMDLLYEPVDDNTALKLATLFRETATLWETRIANIKVRVLPDVANQQYYVEFGYTITGLNDKMVNYKFNISK